VIGLALALGLAATPEASDLAARMRESSTAAQVLQGPLDGTWTLEDARRGPLFVFQITDAAGASGRLDGAWRRSGASAPVGLIDVITRRGDRLAIRFADDGKVVWIRLRRRGDGGWSGEANENGHDRPVTLRRSAPGASAR
jgi:hypothetical protein